MSYNPKNHGTAVGILTAISSNEADKNVAIRYFNANKDGSMRGSFSLLAGDNFRSTYTPDEIAKMSDAARSKLDNQGRGYKSQRIGFNLYLPARDGQVSATKKFYDGLMPGDLVMVDYAVKTNTFVDKDGNTVYSQTLEVDNITPIRKAASKTETPAAAPAAETGVADGEEAF